MRVFSLLVTVQVLKQSRISMTLTYACMHASTHAQPHLLIEIQSIIDGLSDVGSHLGTTDKVSCSVSPGMFPEYSGRWSLERLGDNQ